MSEIKVNIKLRRKNFDLFIKETFSAGITGIYGPSGSGKSSLLNTISGLVVPTEGKIDVNDVTLFNSDKKINVAIEKRNVGYVFQEGRLFPHLSVEKNLLYGAKKNKPGDISFDEVVDMLNLKRLLKSKPASMSGGERQRTALGRALLSSPDILLLDEPFSAVDNRLRDQILPFILKIHQTVKIPILVVSHDLPDLLKLTNKLCIIRNGRCIGHSDYYELLSNPEISNVFGSSSIVNSVQMQVESFDASSGLTILSRDNHINLVKVLCEKSNTHYQKGEELKIFINAEDIAISSKRLLDITIQNQLEGNVIDIIERDTRRLCIIYVGFRLVVEITAESQKRMKIEKGSNVWCLFKSVAIDVAG